MAEHAYHVRYADIPAGTNPAVVSSPDYWTHFAQEIEPLDVIVAFWEDGTRETWFRVMFKSPVGLKLSKLFDVEHEAAGDDDPDDTFKVKWRGPGQKWCVVRVDNNAVLKEKLPSKGEATLFLATYLREMRR